MPGKMACVSLHARLAARLAVRLFESCDREGCRLFDALPMSSLPGVYATKRLDTKLDTHSSLGFDVLTEEYCTGIYCVTGYSRVQYGYRVPKYCKVLFQKTRWKFMSYRGENCVREPN